MARGAKQTRQLTLYITAELLAELDRYWRARGLRSRTAAVIELIQQGLLRWQQKHVPNFFGGRDP